MSLYEEFLDIQNIKKNLYKNQFFARINFRESQVIRENKSTRKLILAKINPLKVLKAHNHPLRINF